MKNDNMNVWLVVDKDAFCFEEEIMDFQNKWWKMRGNPFVRWDEFCQLLVRGK
jgi:hypothetical protein